jgi:hypothetical protein
VVLRWLTQVHISTSDGGKSWKLKKFSEPAASFDWNLIPVGGGSARRNFGAISQGSFRSAQHGSSTDRSWTGAKSATFYFSGDEMMMNLTGAVTVGPMPQATNQTDGPTDSAVAPQFYGAAIYFLCLIGARFLRAQRVACTACQ